MKLSLSAVLLALLTVLPAAFPVAASAQVKIGVVSSATGPMSAVGRPHENAASLLPRRVGDLTVDYVVYDDASDVAQTQALVQKLIATHRVDAIIGPTGSPNALAVIPLVAEAGVPMLAPVGSSAVVLPMDEQKRWVFKTTPNDNLVVEALVGHMGKAGIRNVALMAFDDAYGERWTAEFSAQAAKAGMKVAAVERFRADAPADAATARLIAARPDAVLIAGTGLSALAPHLALVDQGYKGAIYHTHAAASMDFIRRGDKKVAGALLAVSPMLALQEIPDGNPSKALARGYVAAYEKRHGARAVTYGANVYDAGLLLHNALAQAAKRAKPGTAQFRAALRDALEGTREFVATQGVFNMSPQDHSGLDKRSRVMVVIRDHTWKLVAD
jgi:branched-chain amino acid transport system substrate-binding protein